MTIGIASLLLRLLLAAVFAVAGVAKLTDINRSRKAVRDFGLPDWAAQPLGVILPIAELLCAVLLVPAATVLWGRLGTVVLLLLFIIAIGINLSLGRKPDCNCFGQVSSKPIGWPTLVRNIALLACTGVVLWDWKKASPLSLFSWMASLSPLAIVTVCLAAYAIMGTLMGAWLAFHLFRQNGRLLLRMDALEKHLVENSAQLPQSKAHVGPPIGTPAPYFELPSLDGTSKVSLHTLIAEKRPVALIFSDPDCGPCAQLMPDIARWQQEHTDILTVALVSRGSREANRAKSAANPLRFLLLQNDREVAAAYQANGTPGAILIGTDGRIASGLAMGSQAIVSLVATATRPKHGAAMLPNGTQGAAAMQPAPGLPVGAPAPVLRLPDILGNIVDLGDLRDQETLVLFWNPTCGFCARMLADLREWEQRRTDEMPQLLVVSTGTVEANTAMGLESTVVLDQDFLTGRAFQVLGTPSAVLVDSDGKIGSKVVSGAPGVLALASAPQRKVTLNGKV